ncbi:MAG: putative porin [Candidatus Omnitrophica bacterium]|nr:putative porin [Candidatus Omnitrophota bacterium]
MKKIIIIVAVAFAVSGIAVRTPAWAGEVDILVTKLVQKGILTPAEAQVILDETKQESAKELAKALATTAPEWSQRIKVKGDVRVRNQVDWAKNLSNTTGTAHQEIRQRVRARVGVEAKINDQVYGGVRLASGSSNAANSTNQTLTNTFNKKQVWIDQAYLSWFPQFQYLQGSSLWAGKFAMPFETTEMTWDSDINPEGMVFKYVSPAYQPGGIPEVNLFSNIGMLWLEEFSNSEADKLMWVWQAGLDALVYKEWDERLKFTATYWVPSNIKDQTTLTGAHATNSTIGTYPTPGNTHGMPDVGYYRYNYEVWDFLVNLDGKKIMDYDIGHGLFAQILKNPDAESCNAAYSFGGYLGNKKLKNQGEWKAGGDFRYIERDAILDVFPDSDFFAFSPDGTPQEGGTNVYGFKLYCQYALLKNTFLNLAYYWTNPIKHREFNNAALTGNNPVYSSPRQLFQADIVVAF